MYDVRAGMIVKDWQSQLNKIDYLHHIVSANIKPNNGILAYTQNYRKEISKVRKQGMLTSPEHRRFRIRINVACEK